MKSNNNISYGTVQGGVGPSETSADKNFQVGTAITFWYLFADNESYPAGRIWAMDVTDREDKAVDRSNPGVLG